MDFTLNVAGFHPIVDTGNEDDNVSLPDSVHSRLHTPQPYITSPLRSYEAPSPAPSDLSEFSGIGSEVDHILISAFSSPNAYRTVQDDEQSNCSEAPSMTLSDTGEDIDSNVNRLLEIHARSITNPARPTISQPLPVRDDQLMPPPDSSRIPWLKNKIRENHSKHAGKTHNQYKNERNMSRRKGRQNAKMEAEIAKDNLELLEKEWRGRPGIENLEAFYERKELTFNVYYESECKRFWDKNKAAPRYTQFRDYEAFKVWLHTLSNRTQLDRSGAAHRTLVGAKIKYLEQNLETTTIEIRCRIEKEKKQKKKVQKETSKQPDLPRLVPYVGSQMTDILSQALQKSGVTQ